MKKLPYIVSDIHPMFSSSIIKKSLLVGASLSLVQLATAQNVVEADSIVVENGMFFGDGDDDPALSKDPASKDFNLDLAADGVFSMFRGTDPLPTFKAGEGNSANVVAGKWYRIAKGSIGSLRTNALFNLRDTTSSSHNNITFRTGMSYNRRSLMNFTLLSSSRYNLPVFSEVRYLSAGIHDEFYLEVKIVRNAAVSYSIMENLGNSGFEPIDWVETTSIPAGYTETNYELDKLFVVAGETPVLSVDRTEGVAINGDLELNGSSVVTEDSLQHGLSFGANSLEVTEDFGGEFNLSLGEASASGSSIAIGEYTSAENNSLGLGFGAGASGSSIAIGKYTSAANNSIALGFASTADGEYSSALGHGTLADADAATSLGEFTWARAPLSLAAGNSTFTNGYASAVFGQYNEGDHNTDTNRFNEWIGDDKNPVFEIGIGLAPNDRKNAMTIMQDGTIELGKDQNNEIPLKVNSDGSVILNGDVILNKVQGDIPMGIYGQ